MPARHAAVRTLECIYSAILRERIELPDEAAVPMLKRRKLPAIGTLTLQRGELDSREMRTANEIKAAAAALAAAPRAARGPRAARAAPDRPTAPPIDSLVGKDVRFVFEMEYRETGKKKVKGLFECPGHIERVSDASTTVGRKKLGVGFAYITWSDSTASWQLLRPGYYGHHRAAGWRLPADGEDASLDETFEFEDDDDDGDAHSSDEEHDSDDMCDDEDDDDDL